MGWMLSGFALVALVDLMPLIRRRKGRAIAAFLLLFCIALALAVLQILGVQIPSTMNMFGDFYKSIGLAYAQ